MRLLFAFLLYAVFTGCTSASEPTYDRVKTDNVLEKEKFIEVLTDAQILESTLKLKLIRTPDLKERIPGFYQQVFDKHQTTETAFTESMNYYSANATELIEIWDSVEVSLKTLKENAENNRSLDLDLEAQQNKKR